MHGAVSTYDAFLYFADLKQGKILPVIGLTYRLSEVQEAHREVVAHTKGTLGKIILLPWE